MIEKALFLPVAAAWFFSFDFEQTVGVPLPLSKSPWAIYTLPAKHPQLLCWETKQASVK